MEFSTNVCALRYSWRDQSGLQENTGLKMKQDEEESFRQTSKCIHPAHRYKKP